MYEKMIRRMVYAKLREEYNISIMQPERLKFENQHDIFINFEYKGLVFDYIKGGMGTKLIIGFVSADGITISFVE